jgi:hypothetical protein
MSEGTETKNALLVVASDAVGGREDEFQRWYADEHMVYTLNRLDGFVSARQYRREDLGYPASLSQRYMVVYEIPPEALETAKQQLAWQRAERIEALAAGREPYLPLSDSMDTGRLASGLFVPITGRVRSQRNSAT